MTETPALMMSRPRLRAAVPFSQQPSSWWRWLG